MSARTILAACLLCLLPACGVDPASQLLIQIETNDPEGTMRGYLESYGGTPGTGHYGLWSDLAGGETILLARLVVVPTNETDAPRHRTPIGSPQVRDLESGDFVGYINTVCSLGPCGGLRFVTPNDLSSATTIFMTREPEGATGSTPSDDQYLRGPIQPWARGTIRGLLASPDGERVPRGEVTVIPLEDDATL